MIGRLKRATKRKRVRPFYSGQQQVSWLTHNAQRRRAFQGIGKPLWRAIFPNLRSLQEYTANVQRWSDGTVQEIRKQFCGMPLTKTFYMDYEYTPGPLMKAIPDSGLAQILRRRRRRAGITP